MNIRVVDRFGRVVVPAGLRRKFKMKAGTKVTFIDTDDGVVVRVVDKSYFDSLAGALGLKGLHLKSLMEGKKYTQSFNATYKRTKAAHTKQAQHTPTFGHPSLEGN